MRSETLLSYETLSYLIGFDRYVIEFCRHADTCFDQRMLDQQQCVARLKSRKQIHENTGKTHTSREHHHLTVHFDE
jgi:hypothetical protein